MGVTLEGTGSLRSLQLPRKRSKTPTSKRTKKFDPHAAFDALVRAARVGIDERFSIDIANGEGIVVDLGALPHMPELRKLLVQEINTAAKRVDAVIHVVETEPTETRRPRVLVAVLPPDVDLSAARTRMMLQAEILDAVRPVSDRRVSDRAVEAYDLLRARVGDALALAAGADDVLDAIPNVGRDRERSRRLSRLHYFVRMLHELLDEIVTEGEEVAAELVHGHAPPKPTWPANKSIPTFRSVEEEDAFWNSHEFEALEADNGWEEIEGSRSARSTKPTTPTRNTRQIK